MVRFVWLLLETRLRLMWNSFRRRTIWAKVGWFVAAVGLVGGGGLSALAGYGLSRLLEVFADPDVQPMLRETGLPSSALQPEVLVGSLLGLMVIGVWGIIFLSSLGTALNNFYLSSDLDLLVTAPIPMRAIFAAKFLEGLGVGYLLLFTLGGPALVGLGVGAGYSAAYYAGAALVLLLLPLLPESLGTLLVMPLVRIVPPKRLREVLQVLGALIGVAFYFFSQLSQDRTADSGRASALVGWLSRLNISFLPNNWAARGLLAFGHGHYLEAVIALGALTILSGGVFALCLLAAERLYYSGWANLQSAPSRPARRSRREEQAGRVRELAFLPRAVQGLLTKDLLLFFRDPQGWSEMLMPIAVYVLFLVQGLGGRGEQGGEGLALGMSAFVFFLVSSMVSRLGLAGVGTEGQQVWLIKTAPVPPRQILWAKFLAAYLLFLVMSALMLAGMALAGRAGGDLILGNWLLVALLGLGGLAMGVGLGASFPRFETERRRQHVSPGAGCLYFPLLMVYAGVISVLLLLPAALTGLLVRYNLRGVAIFLWTAGPALAAALTAAAFFLPLRWGARRLDSLEV